jgi:GNAT superfamily N-acetyltransferase
MHLRRIEEASLNAWPALQQLLYDGWILRFSQGYTKRANSINPLFESRLPVEEKVAACEEHYARRGLAAVFRLTPFCSPPQLDEVLEGCGYRRLDPTLVLQRALPPPGPAPCGPLEVRRLPPDEWMETFCRLTGAAPEGRAVHRAILAAIPSPRLPAALVDGGRVVACGLGVLEDEYFGLFDLVTQPEYRRRGYGTALVAGMLRWAAEQGGRLAYLQVLRANEPARRLYDRLGFGEGYEYWYRVP